MFFAQDRREIVKQAHPGVSFGDIGKLLAEEWRACGDEEMKSYLEQAAKDRARFTAEMDAYESAKAGAEGNRASASRGREGTLPAAGADHRPCALIRPGRQQACGGGALRRPLPGRGACPRPTLRLVSELVPRQATFALSTTARRRSSLACLFRQMM